MVVSIAATLATWSLVAMNLDRLPLSSIPATLLALPAMPFILVGVLVTCGLGLVHPALGQIAGWLTFVPLSSLLGLVSSLPATRTLGHWIGTPVMVAWYGLLAALLFVPGRVARAQGTAVRLISAVNHTFGEPVRHENQQRWLWGFVFLALALLGISLALWFQVFQGTDGKLPGYFLDVGQSDSILIVTPRGKQVLVDCGPNLTSATGFGRPHVPHGGAA